MDNFGRWSIQFCGSLAVMTRKFWFKTHGFASPAFAGFAFIETYVFTTQSITQNLALQPYYSPKFDYGFAR